MEKQFSPLAASRFIVGRGSISYLKELGKKRAAVIYDGRILTPLLRDRIDSLIRSGGGECRFVSDIRNEPFFSDIKKGAADMESFAPDLIVAIGGGSVMDTAKAMHLFYEYPGLSIADSLKPYQLPELGRKAVMAAVPTTSGTGSETTSAAVFIDQDTRAKHLMLSNNLIPAYAILDADLTDSLPATVAAHTGMDALTHAMEASVCVTASPLVVSVSLGAALDLLENLKNSVSDQVPAAVHARARETCHVAASLAGMVITNCCAGLAHGLDQAGPYYNLPHGMICGLMLPYTTAFSSPHPSYAALARRLGLKGADDRALCQALVDHLWDFGGELGIPHSFGALGLDEADFMDKLDDFARLGLEAIATKLSPRVPTLDEAREIFRSAYYGRRPQVR
ncbi:NADPH-dependent butanol dehydrogenase [Oscillospiraceae bacterium]|nr:NADPH-dependent butanol dehydrogenase [Oscillospiraceae bacterium]BDF76321.1 NADPH-dependent butanol dehydrogenase [Oscillospiraceae bacterium]